MNIIWTLNLRFCLWESSCFVFSLYQVISKLNHHFGYSHDLLWHWAQTPHQWGPCWLAQIWKELFYLRAQSLYVIILEFKYLFLYSCHPLTKMPLKSEPQSSRHCVDFFFLFLQSIYSIATCWETSVQAFFQVLRDTVTKPPPKLWISHSSDCKCIPM